MFKKIKSTTKKTVLHVHRHRGKYSAALTAAAFLSLSKRSSDEFTAFLESKGIDPNEYWLPEE